LADRRVSAFLVDHVPNLRLLVAIFRESDSFGVAIFTSLRILKIYLGSFHDAQPYGKDLRNKHRSFTI
jgi:hypothetical protein